MRILVVNSSSRKIAGIEDYLTNVLPALQRSGYKLAFAHEVDTPQARERIPLPEGTPSWDVSVLGMRRTLDGIKAWHPDLIYAHGLLDTEFEAGFLKIAPAVYFTHNYYGTCISGLKTFKFPVVRPCSRRFGPACLLHYLPRRCGGRNPFTMWKLYRRESRRLKNLSKYRAIVTHSRHMRDEYIRNGLPEARVHSFAYEVAAPQHHPVPGKSAEALARSGKAAGKGCWNLLFVGRMELLKGGALLLGALPAVARQLGRRIRLVLAGDGPERKAWEKKASKLQAEHPSLEFEFTGWVDRERLDLIYAETDLLVVPSLWPEPFGRIGPEAGLRGVPCAAFQVGGVTDWLMSGVNGYLASGDPPTAAGLAGAIGNCLKDPNIYRELCAGAVTVASQFNLDHHLEGLYGVFDQVK